MISRIGQTGLQAGGGLGGDLGGGRDSDGEEEEEEVVPAGSGTEHDTSGEDGWGSRNTI